LLISRRLGSSGPSDQPTPPIADTSEPTATACAAPTSKSTPRAAPVPLHAPRVALASLSTPCTTVVSLPAPRATLTSQYAPCAALATHLCFAQPPVVYQQNHPTPTIVRTLVEPPVYHPIIVTRDPRSTYLMVTCRATGITKHVDCLHLFVITSPPLSLVPSFVRSALTDPR
jgi:hypothetical protein